MAADQTKTAGAVSAAGWLKRRCIAEWLRLRVIEMLRSCGAAATHLGDRGRELEQELGHLLASDACDRGPRLTRNDLRRGGAALRGERRRAARANSARRCALSCGVWRCRGTSVTAHTLPVFRPSIRAGVSTGLALDAIF